MLKGSYGYRFKYQNLSNYRTNIDVINFLFIFKQLRNTSVGRLEWQELDKKRDFSTGNWLKLNKKEDTAEPFPSRRSKKAAVQPGSCTI